MTVSPLRPETSVVIPSFNESGNVAELTRQLSAALVATLTSRA